MISYGCLRKTDEVGQVVLHGSLKRFIETRSLRELLSIAGAQHHIRIGPVLRIEERIAPDRDPRIGFGDLAELHSVIAFARIRADRLREHANADLELRPTSSSIACMIEGTPAITITLPIQKPGAPDTLLRMRSAPLGMWVRRRRASFISAPDLCRMASARGSVSIAPCHDRRIPSFRRQHADRCCRPIRQCRNCLVSRTVAAAAARRGRHAWVSATRRFLAAAPRATSLLRLAPGRFQMFRVSIEKPVLPLGNQPILFRRRQSLFVRKQPFAAPSNVTQRHPAQVTLPSSIIDWRVHA
jgi:hypothetical protein